MQSKRLGKLVIRKARYLAKKSIGKTGWNRTVKRRKIAGEPFSVSVIRNRSNEF